MNNLGIYIHIPFCKSKCAYCDFYSLKDRGDSMNAYLEALISHIRETAISTKLYTVDTIYFGGGTPTCFGEKRLISLLCELKKRFNVSAGAEITLEANPDSVTLKFLKKLRRSGFNRISIGMQSASDTELSVMERPHTYGDVEAAFGSARGAGFENVSLDIIYGLPGQSMDSFSKSLDAAVSLGPEHISCYGLKLEEGTPFYLKRANLALPDDDAQADMYIAAVSKLDAAGFKQYEISNFSKPGKHSRHNMKYWNLEEYVGFGASAHSDLGGRRYSFIRDLDGYINGLKNGDSIVSDYYDIPAKDRAGEYLMLKLRTTAGINAREYTSRFRLSFDPLFIKLSEYMSMGLASVSDDNWRLTPKGFLLSNRIIGDIIESQSEKRLTFSDFKNAL